MRVRRGQCSAALNEHGADASAEDQRDGMVLLGRPDRASACAGPVGRAAERTERKRPKKSFLSILSQGGRSRVGRGEHPIHRCGTVPGPGEAEGRQRDGSAAGGHPRFPREAPMPPERPGSPPAPIPAARSRGLPDARKVERVPVQRTHRRFVRLNGGAGSRKRRAAGGGGRWLRRARGGKGVYGGFRDTHRCGSLRRHDGRPCRAADSRRCLRPGLR
jgi:hypothetical protein